MNEIENHNNNDNTDSSSWNQLKYSTSMHDSDQTGEMERNSNNEDTVSSWKQTQYSISNNGFENKLNEIRREEVRLDMNNGFETSFSKTYRAQNLMNPPYF